MINTLRFTVVGDIKMNCSGCEGRVLLALKRLPGVKSIEADSKTQHIAVTADSDQISSDQVQAAISKLGYDIRQQSS